MDKKKLMLLINPVAGRGGFRSNLGDVLEVFSNAGYLTTVYMTEYVGHATEIAATEAVHYDLLVCMGGDGTLSEVVSGVMRMDDAVPIGYIPMGTANDVASTLSLPKQPVKAAQKIVEGSPMPFDVGEFDNAGYFTYIAAFGAFTEVSYATSQQIKHTIGHLAYVLEGMRHIPSLSPMNAKIIYDDGIIDDEFIFGAVTNSTSIAGLIKLDEGIVELGDGLFEMILVRNPRGFMDINILISDVLSRNFQSAYVSVLHTKAVRFVFDREVTWTRDGENGGGYRDIELINHHAAVKFVV